jgi:integrase
LDSPSKRLAEIVQKNNLPSITPHSLRHTGATLLAAEGVDIKTIQGHMGHSRASTTMDIYAHYLDHMENVVSSHLTSTINNARKKAK